MVNKVLNITKKQHGVDHYVIACRLKYQLKVAPYSFIIVLHVLTRKL